MKNFAVLIAALIVSFLGAEAAMRIAGFAPRTPRINAFFMPGTETTWSVPDSELGWINKEGVSRSIEQDRAEMTFWDFSRRASRPDPALPGDGRIPVMIIGGSNAQAYGVRDEESFAYRLAQRYPNLWIENFGTGGYGTVQAMLLAERAYEKFYGADKPRLILLAFDDSHALRNVADQSWIYAISDAEGRYVAPPHFRLQADKLVFHPFRTIGYWPLEGQSAALTVLHNVWLQSVAYNTAGQSLPVTGQVIDRLAAFAARHNAQFAAVVLEDYKRIGDTVFDGRSFPYKNCSGFERSAPAEYLLGGGSHPNAKLHAHFADCIAAWLDTDVLPKVEGKP
jgi:hypothetical protein